MTLYQSNKTRGGSKPKGFLQPVGSGVLWGTTALKAGGLGKPVNRKQLPGPQLEVKAGRILSVTLRILRL